MVSFDEAYVVASNIIKKFEFEAFIIFIRAFQHGWVFEYQAKAYLDTCDYLEMLLDSPYILIDKNTRESFFLYMKPSSLEDFINNYSEKNRYLGEQLILVAP